MPTPSMNGAETAGRIFALEALVIALAAETAAGLPEDKVAAMFADVKAITHAIIDEMSPTVGPTPPLIKEIEAHADSYVDSNVETISRIRGRILKGAPVTGAT